MRLKTAIPSKKPGQTCLAMNKFLHVTPDSGVIFDDVSHAESVYDTQKVKNIAKNLRDASEILEQIRKVPYLCDKEHLTAISLALMKAEMELRDLVSRISMDVEKNSENLGKLIPEGFCTISEPQGAIIRVTLPCILGGRTPWYVGNGNENAVKVLNNSLYTIIKIAISGYLNTHKLADSNTQKVLLIFKRYLKRDTSNALRYCDNNNIEAGAITNAISQTVGKSDNYKTMDFLYTSAVECSDQEEERVEVTLISKAQLSQWIGYIGA